MMFHSHGSGETTPYSFLVARTCPYLWYARNRRPSMRNFGTVRENPVKGLRIGEGDNAVQLFFGEHAFLHSGQSDLSHEDKSFIETVKFAFLVDRFVQPSLHSSHADNRCTPAIRRPLCRLCARVEVDDVPLVRPLPVLVLSCRALSISLCSPFCERGERGPGRVGTRMRSSRRSMLGIQLFNVLMRLCRPTVDPRGSNGYFACT
ncbi:hypothetical protein DFH09DRAFT_1155048 [Mycena vulgaris]|nr:hypothetical protein DFH09DRAFT_1155048 [Mycena vulgaris]